MNKVFLAGYQGQKLSTLVAIAEQMDAVVADIRMSPRSRVPEWNQGAMERALGKRYRHVPQFGNANFKVGPIKLHQPKTGATIIEHLLESNPVILLCVCKEQATCHRSDVAKFLESYGLNSLSLLWITNPDKVVS